LRTNPYRHSVLEQSVMKAELIIWLFSILLFSTSLSFSDVTISAIAGSAAKTGPIYPIAGQYANFSFLHYDYNGTLISTGYYNITYRLTDVPLEGCINVTRDIYLGGPWPGWHSMNTSDRRILDRSYNMWSGASYYEFWIPPTVGIGDNITWWTTPGANATVTGEQTMNLLNRTIDCWKLVCTVAGVSPDPKDLNNTAWFDKSSGHCVRYIYYQTDGYYDSSILNTNIVWQGETIHIRADGSIDPPAVPIQRNGDVYTLFGNINSVADGIVIERDNMTLDGAGYTMTGLGSGSGIAFTSRSNVTVRNTQIRAFYIGIWLNYSSDCMVSENNITINQKGIKLDSSSNNNISHDRVETNFDYGISLYYSNQNNLSSNIASNNDLGFWVESSTNNSISHNTVTANSDYGIKLVDTSSNNIIFENEIMNQPYGIDLYRTNSNHVLANNITGNSEYGITLERDDCFNNTISENNIADNYYGIALYSSSNNRIYHNSLFNNTYQASSNALGNVWDDGYPSGGNYWSDYNGTDLYNGSYQNETGSDGIGDIAYTIDANSIDRYPLMAPLGLSSFVVNLAGTTGPISVGVMSNSTVSNVNVDEAARTLSFNVSGATGTQGFCRIILPNIIVESLWNGNYTVLLNGEPLPFTNSSDNENTYIYLNYTHSEHNVTIIPEFSSPLAIPALMMAILLAVVICKKKREAGALANSLSFWKLMQHQGSNVGINLSGPTTFNSFSFCENGRIPSISPTVTVK